MPQPLEPDVPNVEDSEPDYGYLLPPEVIPDTSKIVISDGAPVDSITAERQARLLIEPLGTNWKNPSGKPFLALTNVGLFATAKGKPLVPDMMLSLDVPENMPHDESDYRSYFEWIIGKMPEVVIEFVSDHRAKEHTVKKEKYRQLRILYFVVYDPLDVLGEGELCCYQLTGGSYQSIMPAWLPTIGLGLRIWTGEYFGQTRRWLRWCDAGGEVIPTGQEKMLSERERADIETGRALQIERRLETERQRAEQEKQRAEQEKQRADETEAANRRLKEKLRAAGIDPG